jgi:hypothetical protein
MRGAVAPDRFAGTILGYHDLDQPTDAAVESGSRYVVYGPKEFFWTSAMAERAYRNESSASDRANQLRLISLTSALDQLISMNWSKRFGEDPHSWLSESHSSTLDFISASVEINTNLKIEAEFRDLAQVWRKETINLSFSHQKSQHQAYKEIIALGWPVVPIILAELKQKPSLWFDALTAITGEDPIVGHPEVYGDVKAMAQCWIDWGKQKGF